MYKHVHAKNKKSDNTPYIAVGHVNCYIHYGERLCNICEDRWVYEDLLKIETALSTL